MATSVIIEDEIEIPMDIRSLAEFWLADARKEPVLFRIHHWVEGTYCLAEADAEGYLRSNVFDCRFRLDATRDARGHWKFSLLDRP